MRLRGWPDDVNKGLYRLQSIAGTVCTVQHFVRFYDNSQVGGEGRAAYLLACCEMDSP